MNNQIIAGLIVGASIIAAIAMWIYFSPYHTCMRALEADIPNIPNVTGLGPRISKVEDRIRLCLGK